MVQWTRRTRDGVLRLYTDDLGEYLGLDTGKSLSVRNGVRLREKERGRRGRTITTLQRFCFLCILHFRVNVKRWRWILSMLPPYIYLFIVSV